MDFKRKKRILIFFFIVIWLILFYFAYQQYLKKIQNNVIYDDFAPANISFLDEQDEKNEKLNMKKEQEINTEQDEESIFFHPETDSDNINYLGQEGLVFDGSENSKNFFDEDEAKDILCGDFPCYSGEEFLDLFSYFEKQDTLEKDLPYLYENQEVDNYLKNIAEKRGYTKHFFVDETNLVNINEYKTRLEVKEAYLAMSEEMKKENIFLHFVSGYRSFDHQNRIFTSKMGNIESQKILNGEYDEKIMKVLNLSALPGYSKHHTGYAVDFGCGDDFLVYQFADTTCYSWLSNNNFENAKRFGFIPSYPNAVLNQGPNPEPWEYLWVGSESIKNKEFKNSFLKEGINE